MRKLFGNVTYAVSVLGILAAFFQFLVSGNEGVDAAGAMLRGSGYFLAGLVLFFVSQRICPGPDPSEEPEE